jgi:Family of unknown function (DUF5681)
MKKTKKPTHKLAPVRRRKRGKPFQPGNTIGARTRFPKGVSGNPEGRTKTAFVVQAARELLSAQIPDDPHSRSFAEGICHRLGWMALRGDRGAAETLFERAEGRPRQSIGLHDDSNNPLMELIACFKGEYERITDRDDEQSAETAAKETVQ